MNIHVPSFPNYLDVHRCGVLIHTQSFLVVEFKEFFSIFSGVSILNQTCSQVSFLEVYCENAFDLLSGPVSASREPSGACALREAADGRVYADGAKDTG